ncbi:hypothetical protein H6P81_012771 [Aristolochia fimbriata]|uniref:Uncharacterized protein n=1 Tax=Aristolochia fimbriata TaxID=158543 RepID=A0AAV7EHE0_ARIFI|nr:hypothetical protein H6P81_012771 [Aristolochia fimbriata]
MVKVEAVEQQRAITKAIASVIGEAGCKGKKSMQHWCEMKSSQEGKFIFAKEACTWVHAARVKCETLLKQLLRHHFGKVLEQRWRAIEKKLTLSEPQLAPEKPGLNATDTPKIEEAIFHNP